MPAPGSAANRWRPDLVPADFSALIGALPAEEGPTGAEWLDRLPHLIGEVLDEWHLVVTGPARSGHTALLLPVEREGEPLALKLVWPHREAVGEPAALRYWAGAAAVRLVAADPGRGALLLERLDASRDLNELWIDEACTVIGGLYRELHRPAGADVLRLTDFLDEQVAALAGATDILPRRVIDRGAGLYRNLRPDTGAHLLHTDLHFDNVLWRESEQRWVAIDPKPMAGHPGFELHPVLRNRAEELGDGAAFRWSVRHRVELVCEAAGIDEGVARAWTIVAAAVQALWAGQDQQRAGSASAAEVARDTVTWNLRLMKALED